MTDADIKKALECCADTTRGCEDCPFVQIECIVDRENVLMKSALDLINRKDAEIEKLNVELVGMRGACESYKICYDIAQTEIERLQNEKAKLHQLIPKMIKEAKSEAIKEFAERFKEKYEKPFFYLGSYERFMREVDNLVKEMTEGCENV